MAVEFLRRIFSGHQLEASPLELAGLVLLAAVLFGGATVGLSYVAGFHLVWDVLRHPHWGWLVASAAAAVLSCAGYAVGYRGVSRVEHGPDLEPNQLFAVVAAAFGGLLGQGAGALDHYAMKAAGASDRDARARVAALGGLEQGSLPWIVCPTAAAMWIIGVSGPLRGFVIPWAVIPPVGFAIGIWAAERWRDRLRGRPGWRRRLAVFFDGVHYLWSLVCHPLSCGSALAGMLLFWGANMFSLWAALAAFGLHMPAGTLIVCFGSAYLFTQRTAPLGGEGLLMTALVPTLWYAGGVPFAVAVVGVFVHRLFGLWLFVPLALSSLPTLRALGGPRQESGTSQGPGEPALQH